MLEFKEVIYLYRLTTSAGGTEDINTTGGYAHIDYARGYYWHPLMSLPGVPATPWNFLKEGYTLYIMKKEPCYYA